MDTEHNEGKCGLCCRADEEDGPEEAGEAMSVRRVVVFAAALLAWLAGFALSRWARTANLPSLLSSGAFFAAYALAGYPVWRNTVLNLAAFVRRRGKSPLFDENALMAIASAGAFILGEQAEGVAVMVFYMLGEMLQDAAVGRSVSSINALLALKPDSARAAAGEGEDAWRTVPAESVAVGTIIQVRPGERIPLDGLVRSGEANIDASSLTGESRPVPAAGGDAVKSGTVCLDGVLEIETTRTAGNSQAARIIALVQNARAAKARPEKFITTFARYYTPAVIGAAALLAVLFPLLVPGETFAHGLYRALIFLVISCPCALVVSVPLSYFAGLGGMSRRGILVKGAVHLDTLQRVKVAAFDKTGTLTTGLFTVIACQAVPAESEADLLAAAALAESRSNHPIAKAICAARGKDEREADRAFTSYREIAGQGIEAALRDGDVLLAGNRRLLESRGVAIPASAASHAGTAVYVARNGAYLGRVLVGDAPKEGAAEAIRALKALGVRETVMLTGDTEEAGRPIAQALGLDDLAYGLLPDAKIRELEKRMGRGATLYAGDGLNDAPVLARADVGVALGCGEAALEAADVTILSGDVRRVGEAIVRARKTRAVVIENVAFALSAKAVFLALAGLGLANMWAALLADVGVCLAAILNALRASGVRQGKDRSRERT